MKFSVARQDLMNLLLKLQSVIPQKSTLPVISNILVEAKGTELTLTASDLTVSIKGTCGAKVIEPGITTLPAKRFTQLIRELTAQQLDFKTNKEHITEIIASSSRFKLHGMGIEEFPSLPDLSEALRCTIDQENLKNCLFRTAFTVAREDQRYVLTGVLVQISRGIASFIGTDGKRLAKAHAPIDSKDPIDGSYVLPIKAVEELLKTLEDSGTATLYLLPDKIGIDTSTIFLVTKLLEGEFPDYKRVIPKHSGVTLPLHRDELVSLLKQISLFTSDTAQPVRFTFEENELRLCSNAMDIGEGKVSMPVNYSGAKFEIAFNPGYFLDILRHCNEETISLDVTDPFNPGILVDSEEIKGAASNVDDLFILMPMRLEEN